MISSRRQYMNIADVRSALNILGRVAQANEILEAAARLINSIMPNGIDHLQFVGIKTNDREPPLAGLLFRYASDPAFHRNLVLTEEAADLDAFRLTTPLCDPVVIALVTDQPPHSTPELFVPAGLILARPDLLKHPDLDYVRTSLSLELLLSLVEPKVAEKQNIEGWKDFLDQPIGKNFSVRTENALLHGNIRTNQDLIRCTEADLLKLKNFGKKSLKEVKKYLAGFGLSLGMSEEQAARAWRPPTSK